jgi:hypothetical protein
VCQGYDHRELCTHRLVELGELLALWQPSHSIALLRVWRVTEMSVSKCVRVVIIAELCTHRLSIASSSFCGELLVVATEPEPLRV